mmetsp:Transcript_20848/g.49474  ORF Transcript_20848/g.49474 Transcript_20848/m.49474 type:complete len:442 (+) Transcript_20848:3540-4865(+)
MSPKGACWRNGSHNLDVLQLHKLQIIIIEALVHDRLLQEHDDLRGVVLVRGGQVDVLQVQHQPPAFPWPVDAPRVASGNATELAKLLKHVLGGGLRVAVKHRHIQRGVRLVLQSLDRVANEQVLARPLGAAHDEGLLLSQPSGEEVHVPQHRGGGHQRRQHRRSLHLLQGDLRGRGGELVPHDQRLHHLAMQRLAGVGHVLVGPLEGLPSQGCPVLLRDVAAQAPADGQQEVLLGDAAAILRLLTPAEVAQDVAHHAHAGGLNGHLLGPFVEPLQGPVEELVEPGLQLRLALLWLLQDPGGDQRLHVHVFFRQEDHGQAADGGRRCEPEVIRLEDEVHIGAELNTLAVGHRQQAVVVQDTVQTFHPFRVDVPVANNPIVGCRRLLDDFSCTGCQDSIKPFPGIMVHVPEQSDSVHGLGIHHMNHVLLALLLVCCFKHFPDS